MESRARIVRCENTFGMVLTSLHGPVSSMDEGIQKVKASSSFVDGECQLETQVERFWKLKSIEASDIYNDERGMSVNDRRVIHTWQEGKCMEGGTLSASYTLQTSST